MNSGIPNFPPCSADLPDDWREALLNERTVRLGGPLVAEVMGEWLGRGGSRRTYLATQEEMRFLWVWLTAPPDLAIADWEGRVQVRWLLERLKAPSATDAALPSLEEAIAREVGAVLRFPPDDARCCVVAEAILASSSDYGPIGDLWRWICRIGIAAHRRAKYQREKEMFPFLRYRSDHWRRDPETDHQERHGIILPVEHPAWRWMFPPNGWGCNCRVEQVSEARMRRMSWTVAADHLVSRKPESDGFDQDWLALWPNCGVAEAPLVLTKQV